MTSMTKQQRYALQHAYEHTDERMKHDDDGVEYADPRDFMTMRERELDDEERKTRLAEGWND